MSEKKLYQLIPSRKYNDPKLAAMCSAGAILTYDEPYDIPNDSRNYYTVFWEGHTHTLVLEPFEVQEYTPAQVPQVPASPGGMKYDGGKPRMALLFDGVPRALEAVGQVLTFGAEKYAAHSWQTVPEAPERYKSALLRHLTAVGKGEEIDSESGLHHLAHAACNALFILELALRENK